MNVTTLKLKKTVEKVLQGRQQLCPATKTAEKLYWYTYVAAHRQSQYYIATKNTVRHVRLKFIAWAVTIVRATTRGGKHLMAS